MESELRGKKRNNSASNASAQKTSNGVAGGIYHRPFGDWAEVEENLEADAMKNAVSTAREGKNEHHNVH